MATIQIVGRRSSHFTRMTRIFAEELAVSYELVPIYDMTSLDSHAYSNHPALKLPILRRGDSTLFGALNICRAIAESVDATDAVVWPEDLRDDLMRNAQELVWHGMAAQVQLVVGTVIGKLPEDNIFFSKLRTGLEGSIQWLDAQLERILRNLPAQRRISVFEVSLFCLVEHLSWRGTMTLDRYASLVGFSRTFALKPSSKSTAYVFDVQPTKT